VCPIICTSITGFAFETPAVTATLKHEMTHSSKTTVSLEGHIVATVISAHDLLFWAALQVRLDREMQWVAKLVVFTSPIVGHGWAPAPPPHAQVLQKQIAQTTGTKAKYTRQVVTESLLQLTNMCPHESVSHPFPLDPRVRSVLTLLHNVHGRGERYGSCWMVYVFSSPKIPGAVFFFFFFITSLGLQSSDLNKKNLLRRKL
jgi:hypothetical protein